MISRFSGAGGEQRLVEALRRQRLLEGDESLAAELASVAQVRFLDTGESLVSQGGDDNSIFFLCAGSVSVRVKGRQVAIRRAGDHIGEMALIDPGAPRSASVIAIEPTVVAEVGDADFLALANARPRVWHAIARTLADRLRERDQYVRPRDSVPGLFVGSSSESLAVAEAVQLALTRDPVITRVWTDHVFGASRTALELLEAQVEQTDFALLIVTPDDIVISRGESQAGPRDNVVFELGLFSGALGRGRTFMLVERGVALKLPSDLMGFKPLDYPAGEPATLPARLGAACTEIRQAISNLGPR